MAMLAKARLRHCPVPARALPENRDGLQAHLSAQGIPTAVYYPVPIHEQDFCARFKPADGTLPVTEAASKHVIALPMHPYLEEADQTRIVDAIRAFNE